MMDFSGPTDSISSLVIYLSFYVALKENIKNLSHRSLLFSRDGAYNPNPCVVGPTLGNEVGLFLVSSARFLSNLAGLLVGFIEGGENRQSWLGVSRICRNRCTILFGEGYCFILSSYDFHVSVCDEE